MPRLAVLLLAAGLIVLAACDGGNGDSGAPATRTADTPAATSTSPPEATETPGRAPDEFEGRREPIEEDGTGRLTAALVDVRAAEHDGFDRVVFEFEASRPGYRVEYVSLPITACGSGLPVEVLGDAFLRVRMTPATAHDDAGTPTFGALELTPALATILEVEQTCDFEGEVTWVLGLVEEVDFGVSTFPDPFRVAVDVAHP